MRLTRAILILIIAALLAACAARSGDARNQPPSVESSSQAAVAEQLQSLHEARAEFQLALRDNPNFAPAQLALAQLEATSGVPPGSRDASGG